jgi:diacylglycerol kinase (ATP)
MYSGIHLSPPLPTRRHYDRISSPLRSRALIGALLPLVSGNEEGKRLRIALIAKPVDASVIKELRAAVASLRAAGHRVRPRLTFDAGDATRFAHAATRAGADLVIAAGGDGTINDVVNGMFAARASMPRLGIVPLGTANDFAHGLAIPGTIEEAFTVAVSGEAAEIDVASINDRCFVNVSTGGFGPDITDAASAKSKQRFGKLAYLFSALKKIAELEPMHAVFETKDRVVYDGPFFFYAVGNARHTGGGTPVTPHADYNDERLDVVIVTGRKRRDFLTLLPDLRAGRHADDPDVLYFKTGSLRVRATQEFAVNADGEPVTGPEYRYELMDRTITVMRAKQRG